LSIRRPLPTFFLPIFCEEMIQCSYRRIENDESCSETVSKLPSEVNRLYFPRPLIRALRGMGPPLGGEGSKHSYICSIQVNNVNIRMVSVFIACMSTKIQFAHIKSVRSPVRSRLPSRYVRFRLAVLNGHSLRMGARLRRTYCGIVGVGGIVPPLRVYPWGPLSRDYPGPSFIYLWQCIWMLAKFEAPAKNGRRAPAFSKTLELLCEYIDSVNKPDAGPAGMKRSEIRAHVTL
jgi:hypothetical protein